MTLREAVQRLAWIVSQLAEQNTDEVTVEETRPWLHDVTYLVCRSCKEKAEMPFGEILHRDTCILTAATALMGQLETEPDHAVEDL